LINLSKSDDRRRTGDSGGDCCGGIIQVFHLMGMVGLQLQNLLVFQVLA
jgi:NO-binding membrane sensor protein with MHYT domain